MPKLVQVVTCSSHMGYCVKCRSKCNDGGQTAKAHSDCTSEGKCFMCGKSGHASARVCNSHHASMAKCAVCGGS